VTKVNTEELRALAQRFRVNSIPVFALIKSGREVARQAGAMPPRRFGSLSSKAARPDEVMPNIRGSRISAPEHAELRMQRNRLRMFPDEATLVCYVSARGVPSRSSGT
jgi:thioredoxin-like negative regulator of GroEL